MAEAVSEAATHKVWHMPHLGHVPHAGLLHGTSVPLVFSLLFLVSYMAGCSRSAHPRSSSSSSALSHDNGDTPESTSATPASAAGSSLEEEASLSAPYGDTGAKSDYSGAFAALEVTATVVVRHPNQYTLFGALQHGATLITRRPRHDSAVFSAVAVSGGPGSRQAVLRFSGEDIWLSGLDGPYTVEFTLVDSAGTILGEATHTTARYRYEAFAEYPARILRATERSIGPPAGPFQALEVRADVGVTRKQGCTYVLQATLLAANEPVTSASAEARLSFGEDSVLLTLPGAAIYRAGGSGPYDLEIVLFDDQAEQISDLTLRTQRYDPADFRPPDP